MEFQRTEIKHHPDGSHTVKHFPRHHANKSGAFLQSEEPTSYSAKTHELAGKLSQHLGAKDEVPSDHELDESAE